jgi:hypothetical protein
MYSLEAGIPDIAVPIECVVSKRLKVQINSSDEETLNKLTRECPGNISSFEDTI